MLCASHLGLGASHMERAVLDALVVAAAAGAEEILNPCGAHLPCEAHYAHSLPSLEEATFNGSRLLLRTDNCPQPKEARPRSHALTPSN